MPRAASPVLTIPLVKGIDESADAKVQPYSFSALTNLRFSRPGELVPRDPMKQESSISTRVRRVLDMNGSAIALQEVLATSDSDLMVWLRNDTAGTWTGDTGAEGSRGDTGSTSQLVPLVSDVRRTVIYSEPGATVVQHSVAVQQGYRLHAMIVSTSVVVRLYLGERLLVEHTYTGYKHPKAFAATVAGVPSWVVSAVDGVTSELVIFKLSGLVPASWPLATVLALDGLSASYPAYDMVWSGSSFYGCAGTTTDTTVVWFKGTWAAGVTNTLDISTGVDATTMAISADGTVMAWQNGATTHTRGAVINPATPAIVVAATTLMSASSLTRLAVGGAWSSTYAVIYGSRNTTAGTTPDIDVAEGRAVTFNKTTGAVGSLALDTFYGWHVLGQPALVADKELMLVGLTTQVGAAFGLDRLAVVQWLATTKYPFPVLAGESFVGAEGTLGNITLAERAVYVDSRVYFAGLEYSDDRTEVKAVLYSAEINGMHVAPSVSDGARNRLELGGGLPVALDDLGSPENVPLTYPYLVAAAGAGSGITGTVTYIAVYQVEDSQGRIGWSAPSPATTPLAGLTDDSVKVAIPQLWPTRLPSIKEPKVKLYRSTDSSPYYLVTTLSLTRTTTGATVYTDTTTDPSANALLYSDGTEGSEAERFCPPFTTALAYYRGRMWAASDRRVFFSQPIDSEFMPQWSDVFYVEVPARVTGLAVVRSVLLVFCDDPPSIYAIAGDGPDRANVSGAYGQPELISASVGCPAELGGERSVVVVGSNTFFRSQRGIEVLDAAGQSQIVSHPIRNTLAAKPIVLDAAYWPERDESVWLLSDGSMGRGVAVLNHAMNVWTTWAGSLTADGLTSDALAYYDNHVITGTAALGVWASSVAAKADTKGATVVGITTTMTLSVRPFGPAGRGYLDAIHVAGKSAGDVHLALTQSCDGITPVTTQTDKLEATFAVGSDLYLERDAIYPRGTSWTWSLDAIAQLHELTWRLPPSWSAVSFDVRPLPGSRRPAEKDWM